MNLEELRTVQSTERRKDSLQHLRPSFYREVGEYVSDLEDERASLAEGSEDPFASPEIRRLTDEIETAKGVVEAIYDRRMGKLVKQASLAAAGMDADVDGLTVEEKDLFADLVDRIESNKGRVLDVLADGESAAVPDGEPAEEARDDPATGVSPDDPTPREADADARTATTGSDGPRAVPPAEPPEGRDEPDETRSPDGGVSAADVMGAGPPAGDDHPPGGTPPAEAGESPTDPDEREPQTGGSAGRQDETAVSPAASESDGDAPDDTATDANAPAGEGEDVDRVTVRITRDVGSILGVDEREYTLASDDVVTLPERNATPLLERDAAEPLGNR